MILISGIKFNMKYNLLFFDLYVCMFIDLICIEVLESLSFWIVYCLS